MPYFELFYENLFLEIMLFSSFEAIEKFLTIMIRNT